MDKKEFRKEALRLGYTDQDIDEYIEDTEKLVGKNGEFDYSVFLMVISVAQDTKQMKLIKDKRTLKKPIALYSLSAKSF